MEVVVTLTSTTCLPQLRDEMAMELSFREVLPTTGPCVIRIAISTTQLTHLPKSTPKLESSLRVSKETGKTRLKEELDRQAEVQRST